GLQHVRLGGHVQARGRLVEHDHVGTSHERHRDRHTLLLPSGQLVRVTLQEGVVVGQGHLPQYFTHPPVDLLRGQGGVVQCFPELDTQPQCRVERRSGGLRDVGHHSPAQCTYTFFRQVCQFLAGHLDTAVGDLRGPFAVGQQGQPQRGLSGTGLTHQAEDLTTPHGDRHVADDLHVRGASDHGQSVGHQNGVVCFCHFSTPRSIPIQARWYTDQGSYVAHRDSVVD